MTHKVVVIDPGHNGANQFHGSIIRQQVPDGLGGHKDCNTTGTQTNGDAYPEYKFNWNVALKLKSLLQAKGITVVMTRDSDDGVGPCVNKRAEIGNNADADAVISIHGDGDDSSAHGFYGSLAETDPAGAKTAAESMRLAVDMRNAVSGTMPANNHIGSDGIFKRDDLTGLNMSTRPTVLMELGNMRNSADAAFMSSTDGQDQLAQALYNGAIKYLIGQ
ncbi:MAG: N-acetylmuramoyl-L-alanine amidase [Nakamurella sp.]